MSRSNKNIVYEGVMITDLGSEGKSVARVNDQVVFTTHVIPGDVVDLQVVRKKRKYIEAKVIQVRKYSPDRTPPFCEHFGTCGGCRWQFLPYEKQLFYKEKQVYDQLTRIGGLKLPAISPILGSSRNTFYRNKLEYTFSNKRWLSNEEINSGVEIGNRRALGFHIPEMFDKIIHIRKCWLQGDPSNSVRNFLYNYSIENNLEFFDLREGKGFLRNLIIRTTTSGETMVILVFSQDEKLLIHQVMNALMAHFPEITSLYYTINRKANDTLNGLDLVNYSGSEYIVEEMEGLRFKISPRSFFQTNSEQAYNLYSIVRKFAGLSGTEIVYDLYSGTGTIANFVAREAFKVVGIEYVEDAVSDAVENSKFNNIFNTVFYSGDLKDIMNQTFMQENGYPDVIITDPPRAGMHEKVVEAILGASPGRIVYVSCNPGTQARDLALLSREYEIIGVQPVDMFPHTQHVENVVLLIKRNLEI